MPRTLSFCFHVKQRFKTIQLLSASTFFIFSPCNLNASRLKIPINLNPISTDESSAAKHQKQQQLMMKVIMWVNKLHRELFLVLFLNPIQALKSPNTNTADTLTATQTPLDDVNVP